MQARTRARLVQSILRGVKYLVVLVFCLLVGAALWVLISIVDYGMTFNLTEFDGLKKGMSRAETVAELKKNGVVELVATPDDGLNASKVADARGGYWIRLGEKDGESKFYQHDAWRYQVPKSYSNIDITFKGGQLISIKYQWCPFEG